MNNNLTRIGLIIAAVGVFILGSFGGWWKGYEPKATVMDKPNPLLTPKFKIYQTQLTGWDNEKKAWEIEAEKVWQSEDGNLVYFEDITKGVIYSVKKKRVDFTAGWARWEKLRRELYIGNGFQATIDKGVLVTAEAVMKFRTEEMICAQAVDYQDSDSLMKAKRMKINFLKEELFLDGDVQLTQAKDVVRANGLTYSLKKKIYRLKEPQGVTLHL